MASIFIYYYSLQKIIPNDILLYFVFQKLQLVPIARNTLYTKIDLWETGLINIFMREHLHNDDSNWENIKKK